MQKAVRKFVDDVIYPDAQAREEDGKRPSLDVIAKMAEQNIHAMRLGPGKHLKGRTLMGGVVEPEKVSNFGLLHCPALESCTTLMLFRCHSRVIEADNGYSSTTSMSSWCSRRFPAWVLAATETA